MKKPSTAGRIIVAPNPFSSSLQFYFSLEGYPEDATLIIYTSTGKEIYSTALPKQKEFRVSVDGNRLERRNLLLHGYGSREEAGERQIALHP
jgi:hypothetical protein